MSRFPSRLMLNSVLSACGLTLSGCMYQQPMYQPAPYGQQMYGAPGGFTQPGTMVIPPSNAPPYQPGATGTYESNPRTDDFKAAPSQGDGRFFGEDGGVPTPKDSGAETGSGDEQFNRDLPGLGL